MPTSHNAPQSSVTSVSLLNKAVERQSTAWDELVDRYGPRVYRWCRRMGLSDHDACDAMQEVLTSVTKKLNDFQHNTTNGGFKNWLFTIARNKVRDHWRREKQREKLQRGSTWMEVIRCPSDSHSAADVERRVLLSKVVAEVRSQFSDRDWELFSITTLEGATVEEAADRFSVPLNVVYLARSRIIKRLRESYAAQQ